MTLSQIPYLTIELLEAGETTALTYLPSLVPASAPWVPIIQRALPLIHTIPGERMIIQAVINEINKLTGAQPPAEAS